ncbi:MAG: hypothetical protein ACFFC7_01760 [Candidatus Hermodarchaeota archaeon]
MQIESLFQNIIEEYWPILLLAATGIFAILLAEQFYLRNIMHLRLPKKRDKDAKGLPYDLVTINEVNPPHLRIEWTEFKFISFKNAIRLVFFLFAFAISLIALKLIIFPDVTIYPWGVLEIVLMVITLALVVVPLFIWYFFLEVWLNTDTVIEKIIMIMLTFGSILVFFVFFLNQGLFLLAPGRELIALGLIAVASLLFIPLVYIANLLIGINFGAIVANDWSIFRHGWDYLEFQNKTWFDRISALAGLAIVAPAPIFAVHSILSILTGTVSEGGLIAWFLLPYFENMEAAAALIRLFGIWTIFDTVFLQLAVVLKFLKQTCFISIVGGTSPDAPEGVAPQAVFLTLSYVVYLLFTSVGYLISTPWIGQEVMGALMGNIALRALADVSPLLLLAGNIIFLAHAFFLDWNIYPTESGIIFIGDSEFEGLNTFPVVKYIRRALKGIRDTLPFRGEGAEPLTLRDYMWGIIDLSIGITVFVISILVFGDELSKLGGILVGFVVIMASTFLMPKR